MSKRKQLKEEIIINKNFKLLTRAFQEHAIGQINIARYSVLNSREFADDLLEVFLDVQTSYKTSLFNKSIKRLTKKNGRDVWILITANKKLYGDLLPKICQLFVTKINTSYSSTVDLIIIGKQGKKYFDDTNLKLPYKFYELPDTNVALEFLKDILDDILKYENVVAYYGKFKTLVTQTPVEVYLSGGIKNDETEVSKNMSILKFARKHKKHNFLFEPDLAETLSFFENQIFSHIFNQMVQEAQLARFASRINAMENAQNNIEKKMEQLKRVEKRLKNMEMNKKQLELLAGRALWTRR